MYSATEQLIGWLIANGYEAHTYPQKDTQPPFVTVERTGGGVTDLVDHPTFAVQTWAASEAEAEAMAIDIRNRLVYSLPYGFAQMQVNSGAYPFWDEDTGIPRYQTVYDCTTILIEE